MFPPLQVLSRYTGALAREARLAHLSGVFVSPALVAISRWRLLSAPRLTSTSSTSVEWSHQRHVSSSSAVKPASAQERRREFWKERQSPSERVYVGNLTDANRHEIISFVNALPGLVDIFDQLEGDSRRKTYVYLGFRDTESAKNAVNELDQRFEQAGLRVDFASSQKGPKLFVGDIPSGIRPWVLQTLRDVPGFERFFDHPLKDGSPKDYLHVQYSDRNAATAAHKYLSEAFDKKGIRVDFATERNDPRPDRTEEHTAIPPSSDLFIGNIPYEASESEIVALFNDQPGFIELKLGMDFSGRNKGIAKASFESIHQAKSAMEATNGKPVYGRPIRVVFSRIRPTRPVGKASNMLFIGGLPHDVTEGEVRHGVIGFDGLQQIQINSNPGSGKPAWAIATYEMVEQAIAVVEACHFKPLFPGGPPMRVAYHHLKKPLTGQEQEQYLPSTVLFVGGIRRKTTGDLRDIFARWKPVSARIVTDPSTGEHRGFGFVEFASVEIAASAQKAMHDSDVGESTSIRVSFASPGKERRNTSRNI